jgi:hypothetical protein
VTVKPGAFTRCGAGMTFEDSEVFCPVALVVQKAPQQAASAKADIRSSFKKFSKLPSIEHISANEYPSASEV